LLNSIEDTLKTTALIGMSDKRWTVQLTATTNKAVEALFSITGCEVKTLASALGMRVATDYSTGNTSLVPIRGGNVIEDTLLFVDEASFIDAALLERTFKSLKGSKVIFIGDPAQLTPIKSTRTPVFNQFKESKLTEVVRQAEGNPIIELATLFRNVVNGAPWSSFSPDGHHIQHMPRDKFDQKIAAEFTRPDWTYADSKVLAWTNKTVIAYNKSIRGLAQGNPELQVGDYAVSNNYVNTKNCRLSTDQLVRISDIYPSSECTVDGFAVRMDGTHTGFMAADQADALALVKQAKTENKFGLVQTIQSEWLDLRAAYSCTVNKSQGSTFKKVFIDLDDINKCRNGNQIARMLYVAVSRASDQVILTGDIG
jgi:hypothetical protein